MLLPPERETLVNAGSPDLSALGMAVGHASDAAGGTGLTVIRGVDGPLRAGVALFGGASGSRELHTASPFHVVEGRADALLLTGGSAYGLDAAAGVMRWMEERRRGFDVGVGVVPIVPTAVIFDLAPVGRPNARPTADMAYEACDRATPYGIQEGSVGVGTGATVGKVMIAGGAAASLLPMKGGFGCAATSTSGVHIAAFAAVNAFGDVRDAHGAIIAGARDATGAFADTRRVLAATPGRSAAFSEVGMQNTTLAVVAVSEPLDATALVRLARAAGAALLSRITPAGTSVDGDVVFAVCPLVARPAAGVSTALESAATELLGTAIERAVRFARGRDGVAGLADPLA